MDDRQVAKPPISIKNRDIPLLSRVLYTMQDVSATENKRMWLQDRLWSITQKITGMPGGNGEPKGLDASFAAIGEIEAVYEKECAEFIRELQSAEQILNGIKHRPARTFVTMRYVLHMSRKEIMEGLNMKRWEYERIRDLIEQAQNMALVEWDKIASLLP